MSGGGWVALTRLLPPNGDSAGPFSADKSAVWGFGGALSGAALPPARCWHSRAVGKDRSNTRVPFGVSVTLLKCTEPVLQGGSGAVELRAGAVCCLQSLLSDTVLSQVGTAVPAAKPTR